MRKKTIQNQYNPRLDDNLDQARIRRRQNQLLNTRLRYSSWRDDFLPDRHQRLRLLLARAHSAYSSFYDQSVWKLVPDRIQIWWTSCEGKFSQKFKFIKLRLSSVEWYSWWPSVLRFPCSARSSWPWRSHVPILTISPSQILRFLSSSSLCITLRLGW